MASVLHWRHSPNDAGLWYKIPLLTNLTPCLGYESLRTDTQQIVTELTGHRFWEDCLLPIQFTFLKVEGFECVCMLRVKSYNKELPGGRVLRTLHFHYCWVCSPVRELWSHKPHITAKRQQKPKMLCDAHIMYKEGYLLHHLLQMPSSENPAVIPNPCFCFSSYDQIPLRDRTQFISFFKQNSVYFFT